MLIRIFPHGQGNGKGPVDYLLDHETHHKNAKPELLKGNPDLTKFIIDDLNFKHRYISGVISFRDNEKISKQEMHKLIDEFERVFCPFDDPARVNFLWVLHTDKGNNEIHFVTPRVDLKTGLAFNLHPPGKVNQMFFENFVKVKNQQYDFFQVGKKEEEPIKLSNDEYKQSLKIVRDLCMKRAEFIKSKYCKKEKRKYNSSKSKGKKHGNTKQNGVATKGIGRKESVQSSIQSVDKHSSSIARPSKINQEHTESFGLDRTRSIGNDFKQQQSQVNNVGNEREIQDRRTGNSSANQIDNKISCLKFLSLAKRQQELTALMSSTHSFEESYKLLAELIKVTGQLSAEIPDTPKKQYKLK